MGRRSCGRSHSIAMDTATFSDMQHGVKKKHGTESFLNLNM